VKELKECPFCGGEAEGFINESYYDFYTIRCTPCDFELDGATKREVLKIWNTRTPTVSVEDLRGVVADLKMIPTMSTVNKSVAANEAARTLEQLLAKSEGEMTTTTEHQEEG